MHSDAVIEELEVAAYVVPTDAPEADGTLAWTRTVLVTVEVRSSGVRGLGYTYADEATAKLVDSVLAPLVAGRRVHDVPALFARMLRAVRNLGRDGVAAMAISAVDAALWDLKARLLDTSLVDLLGRFRDAVPAYGSGGFTSYDHDQLQAQLGWFVERGLRNVKMKVGSDPSADLERARLARQAIGAAAGLFVDANGAYARKQALALAESFAALGVTWFEEPVSSDDLPGLAALVARAPAGMDIAAGEYGYEAKYFERLIVAGAVDVVQADATRCGGVTGFLQAAALCDAHGVPLSAHCAPAMHASLGCVVSRLRHVEYFHDHVRIENFLFEGAPQPNARGELAPDRRRHGFGLALRRREAARYSVAGATTRQGAVP